MQKKAQTPRDSGDTSNRKAQLRALVLPAKASEKHLEQLPQGFPLIFREYLFP